ncbi:hypothetical protein MPK66_gp218 [Erwinia phage pEa_SNUABM_2]|uniref:Uncharacterized protein n=1 Tax=Erwinia phage pEa_SNUABM_2 TaxID=2869547 RepID=A0AAE7XPZ3_9CAUD|nr:hypothetical protein MPK66_gp218 [Erwinia phage pEa_SNUABM_2]QZE59462.1 hypothetical protein pEaSNUABM2_00218 [Erwinia phage pEa_SNUABM_2]QZE59798.1 hypothetical protein pEaSNUABM39_00218 [Erwinia phage pEa_SNUABM_39]
MTAIVKDISVHPDFKFHRRGIFDESDAQRVEAKPEPSQSYRQLTSRFLYVDKLSPYVHSPFTPTPEK